MSALASSTRAPLVRPARATPRRAPAPVRAHTVTIQMQDGSTTQLTVEDGTSILEAGLDAGLDLPHDCKMGVCMKCSSRMVSGEIDQSAGMLDDEAKDKGYALMCVAEPQGDCTVAVIDEDELLEEVLQGAKQA